MRRPNWLSTRRTKRCRVPWRHTPTCWPSGWDRPSRPCWPKRVTTYGLTGVTCIWPLPSRRNRYGLWPSEICCSAALLRVGRLPCQGRRPSCRLPRNRSRRASRWRSARSPANRYPVGCCWPTTICSQSNICKRISVLTGDDTAGKPPTCCRRRPETTLRCKTVVPHSMGN